MDKPPEKVLMVDDDRNLLDSFRRQFRKRLNLETATSGADGVQAVRDGGPFAVVISDMQMPNMNGVEFLTKVNTISPNTIRIMLTGNANLDVAIDAVNDGNIFRFLNKPVETEQLYQVIIDSIQQYRLINTEKILLNKTLKGAVDLLADILSMVNPAAFSQSTRIKRHVHTMVKSLSLEDGWHYDLAAMLCHIGFISLPQELISKLGTEDELSSSEKQLFKSHPAIGARLLKHIPRLEIVSAMVEKQQESIGRIDFQGRLDNTQKAILGGQILKVANAYDQLITQGMDESAAIEQLKENPEHYDPVLVETLAIGSKNQKLEVLNLAISELEPGLILDQPVSTESGLLLIAKGQVLSQAVLLRLLAAEESGIVGGQIRVFRITQL
ncbi:MAG: response regulator [Candidatus Thiodiazotropha sp. (ex Monitilora ramsayi)]|nr:response regulator [Candidatus Thiodiazotropha sp. (ex Monitilora ramsayi)]